MKKEVLLAFNELVEDRQLSKEVILEALQSGLVTAYRKTVGASSAQFVEARINFEKGQVAIFAEKEVVEDVQDDRTEVLLSEARQVDPEAELGDMVVVESTPEDFGRVAAQTARQVIQQRIREAERQIQYEYFGNLVGEVVSGVVQAVTPGYATIGLDKKAEGQMLRKDMIPNERLHTHDRIRCLLYEVKETNRGPQIYLSRAHKNFLKRLLENEVPEIYHGVVEIRSIAREPGYRAKVAVSATQQGIDPVGACVGVRGVRIQAIVRELNDEKIDVIEWNNDAAAFISKALSPAKVVGVFLSENEEDLNTATVVVPEDQLSLAIGSNGQNARLAAKLTGWRIDIKSLVEAAADAVRKLQEDPAYAEMAEREAEAQQKVAIMLEKKDEGRPLPPEDYTFMTKFINRVEKRVEEKMREENLEEKRRYDAARATVPDLAYEINILDVDLKEHILVILQGAGIDTLGDLVLQVRLNPDRILGLNGIGPKTFEQIQALTDGLRVSPEEAVSVADAQTEEIPVIEEILEAVPVGVDEPVVETPVQEEVELVEPVAPVKPEPVEKEKEEEPEDDFDKLFTYDAAKYGYYEPEKAIFDDDEEEQIKPTKKKKRKKPRPQLDDPDPWDGW